MRPNVLKPRKFLADQDRVSEARPLFQDAVTAGLKSLGAHNPAPRPQRIRPLMLCFLFSSERVGWVGSHGISWHPVASRD